MKKVLLFFFAVFFIAVFGYASLYQLRPGDVLNVAVYDNQSLSGQYTVGPDGHIQVVPIGDLQVEGMTVQQLSDLITSKMKEFISNPQVTVSIQSYAPFVVYVTGSVKNPGAIQIPKQNATLSTVLSLAGGTLQISDLGNLKIITKNGTPISVDFSGFYTGVSATDPIVSSGETVVVPSEEENGIFVMGEVANPGVVKYTPGMSVLDVMQKVGGFLTDADLSSVMIFSKNDRTNAKTYDLSGIYKGSVPDITMHPGSTFIVPKMKTRFVYVLGAVEKPGLVNFLPDESETLLNAIGGAGNVIPSQSNGTVEIVSKNTKKSYSVSDVLSGTVNVRIENGTLVYLPLMKNMYVTVLGAVKNPGTFQLTDSNPQPLMNVLGMAGGLLDWNNGQVQVISATKTTTIGISPQTLSSVYVLPGQVVYVPQVEQNYITVLGAVKNPGTFKLDTPQPKALSKVLGMAGGLLNWNDNTVHVISATNTEKYAISPETLESVKINPGQVVYIPNSGNNYVTIVGAVNTPGTYELQTSDPQPLMKVLGLAGGLVDWGYGKVRIMSATDTKTYDVASNELETAVVNPGDVIYVPQVEQNYVTVLGAVKNPGTFALKTSGPQSLTKVLGLAGGLLNWNLGQIQIVSSTNTSTYKVSPQTLASVVVNPGQVVYVPTTSTMKVYVFGQVQNPGVYQFNQDMTALEAVLMAGGPTSSGDLSKTYFFKGGPNNSPKILDLSQGGLSANNVILSPGDILYVGQSTTVDIMQIINNVTSLFNLSNSGIQLWRNVSGQ